MVEKITSFVLNAEWLERVETVSLIGAGEYNENYRIDSGGQSYVFRINHGSQLNIDNQIEYEFNVLKALEYSGVTPVPYHVASYAKEFDTGVLMMSFLPGTPLQYKKDMEIAAGIFSNIHVQPISDKLIVQANPVMDIVNESNLLLEKFQDHPLKDQKKLLLGYRDKMLMLVEESMVQYAQEDLCIVNTEVNSGNFLINADQSYLVDWEKAVVSYRYQDLAHFICPTTTLWKTDVQYTDVEKRDFLKAYHNELDVKFDFELLCENTFLMEKVILLRAMSWCYMAYYEYTASNRVLKNTDTFEKIKIYMDNMRCFLA